MEMLRKLYEPFVLARYALFWRSNKNGAQKHDIPDEYNMIAFFNAVSPVWLETVFVLIISHFVAIEVGTRLEIIAGLFVVNILISRIFIIRRLKRERYVERLIEEWDAGDNEASRYNGFLFSFMILAAYAVIPMLSVVMYYSIF